MVSLYFLYLHKSKRNRLSLSFTKLDTFIQTNSLENLIALLSLSMSNPSKKKKNPPGSVFHITGIPIFLVNLIAQSIVNAPLALQPAFLPCFKNHFTIPTFYFRICNLLECWKAYIYYNWFHFLSNSSLINSMNIMICIFLICLCTTGVHHAVTRT